MMLNSLMKSFDCLPELGTGALLDVATPVGIVASDDVYEAVEEILSRRKESW